MTLKWKSYTAGKRIIVITAILSALIVSGILLYIPCWKFLVLRRIESLHLPEASIEVYPAKA